jgi:hypothetical protein
LALTGPGHAQETNLTIAWQRSFGGSSFEYLKTARPTADGGFILGGASASGTDGNKTSPNFGWLDFWLVRLDANGNKVWDKSFGGSDEDSLVAVEQTADGGFILGGSSISPINGNKTSTNWGSFDFWLVRVNANGGKLWEASFGGMGWDSLGSVQPTADGGFIVGGASASGTNGNKSSPNFGNNDYWIIRLDSNGAKAWEKSFGGSGDDSLQALQQTTEGGFIVGGYSASAASGNKTSQNFGDADFWVLKLDGAGNKVWERSFGGSGADRLASLQQIADGGFVLAGETWSGATGNKTSASYGLNDFWVVRLDAAGNKVWDVSLGGLSNERAWSVRQTSDGGFIVGGRSSSNVSGNKTSPVFGSSDYWLVRLDSSGGKLWERAFGGSDYDELYTTSPLPGGYFLAGESKSTNGTRTAAPYGLNDFWVLKLAQGPYVLALTTNGAGRGSISASPPADASGRYASGAVVTLTANANANAGYRFNSWNGDAGGTNNPVPVTMDQDKAVRANFISLAPPVVARLPAAMTNFVGAGQLASTQIFQVWNAGGSMLSYSTITDVPWLSVAPISGMSVEETNTHTAAVTASDLAVGSYRAKITVSGGSLTQTVNVTLVVLPLPANDWQQDFGGRDEDSLTVLERTDDGGFILGGVSDSGRTGNKTTQSLGSNDFWIVRVDARGNKIWDRSFGGRGDDFLESMHPLSDGGFVLAGSSASGIDGNKSSQNFGDADFWVVRLDASGNKIWDRSFGGAGYDAAYAIEPTPDGGFIVGGESASVPGGTKASPHFGVTDFWIVRLDAAGNKIWERSYGGNGIDQLTALQTTPDGGCIVAGNSDSGVTGNKGATNFGGSDFWVLRLDSSGNRVWERTFGGGANDTAWVIEATFDRGFVIGGSSNSGADGNKTSPNFGDSDVWLLCLDANGNRLWDQSFGGSGSDNLFSLRQSTDGGFYLGGGSDSPRSGNKTSGNHGQSDFWVVRLGAGGAKLWDQSFGGSGYDEAYALAVAADGSIVAGGVSESAAEGNKTVPTQGAFDFWLMKLVPDGIQLQSIPQRSEEIRTNGFRFLLWGVSNVTHHLEYTTNFATWSLLQTNLSTSHPTVIIDLSAKTNTPRRWYRARLLP